MDSLTLISQRFQLGLGHHTQAAITDAWGHARAVARAFSSPEAAILLVSTENHDLRGPQGVSGAVSRKPRKLFGHVKP